MIEKSEYLHNTLTLLFILVRADQKQCESGQMPDFDRPLMQFQTEQNHDYFAAQQQSGLWMRSICIEKTTNWNHSLSATADRLHTPGRTDT